MRRLSARGEPRERNRKTGAYSMDIQRELGRAEEALTMGDSHRARAILRSIIEQDPKRRRAVVFRRDAH